MFLDVEAWRKGLVFVIDDGPPNPLRGQCFGRETGTRDEVSGMVGAAIRWPRSNFGKNRSAPCYIAPV